MNQIRIGDTERDAAAAALGEHYAAGRLTKDEYDERIDGVWSARFHDDLRPLFADLPSRAPAASRPAPATQIPLGRPARRVPSLGPLVPALVIALVAIVVITGIPWLLFALFWVWVLGGFGHGGRRQHAYRSHCRQPG
jgi:hypothetical protein